MAEAGRNETWGKRPHIAVRGIYGGIPQACLTGDKTLDAFGVNAIWIGSGQLTADLIAEVHRQGARLFAEFNTMHEASYLETHPEAAPVGRDGKVCPPPEGWQGVCPTHEGYRRYRMDAFRAALRDYEIDGIWLDYHHSHASWEQAVPNLPDTCFCQRCLTLFAGATGTPLPDSSIAEIADQLLSHYHPAWIEWRCGIFTDWVREFREIVDAIRPGALLGTFHCPWSETDFEGALRNKLAIDLRAQAPYLDVFSIMPYHARFAHAADPAWISRQTAWLGHHLTIQGSPAETKRIWPIVQLSDWGETVPVEQVTTVLDHGTRSPATGVMVFAWGGLQHHADRVAEMSRFYRAIGP